jgi:hypothetical protein
MLLIVQVNKYKIIKKYVMLSFLPLIGLKMLFKILRNKKLSMLPLIL